MDLTSTGQRRRMIREDSPPSPKALSTSEQQVHGAGEGNQISYKVTR